MKWVARPRQTGKTTELVQWAREEEPGVPRYIACEDHRTAQRLFQESFDADGNPTIRMPITHRELLRVEYGPRVLLAIDDVDALLHRLTMGAVRMASYTDGKEQR